MRFQGMRASRLATRLVIFGITLFACSLATAQDLVPSFRDIAAVNQTITYKMRVCNNGSGPAPVSQLGLYFNRETGPACNTPPDHPFAIEALAAGACIDIAPFRRVAAVGAHKAWVLADWNCLVAETDETNNAATLEHFVGPNLRIGGLAITPSDHSVTYTFNVRNVGAATTGAFNLGLYYNAATAPACNAVPDVQQTIPAGFAYDAVMPFTHTRANVPTGHYKGWAIADTACAIDEGIGVTGEANNRESMDYSVGTDLEVSPLTVTSIGSSVEYRLRVCNRGTVVTGPYQVALWYDRPGIPTCRAGETSYRWAAQPSLAPGACTPLVHTRSGVPAGTFQAYAYVDPECLIAETRDDNDISTKTYLVVAPDFVFTAQGAQAAFAATVNGTTVNYTAQLCNHGASTTRDILVGLYDNTDAAPSCTSSPTYVWPAIHGLAAGSCTVLNHQQTNVATPGSFTAWVFADHNCQHNEGLPAAEANNMRAAAYAIAPTKSELHVENLAVTVAGQSVTYEARICNAGVAAGALTVGLYNNIATAPACGTPPADLSEAIPSLARGACIKVTKTRNAVDPGRYKAWVLVDSACAIDEHREDNNALSEDYAVAPLTTPDVQVETLTITPRGQTAVFSVKVCNRGTAPSSASQVGVYYDRTTAPAANCVDTPNATADVGALAVDACETKELTQTDAPMGSRTGWAFGDSACTQTESDEGNNTASATYTIAAETPDGGVDATGGPVADRGNPYDARQPDSRPKLDAWDYPTNDSRSDDAGETRRSGGGGCAVQGKPVHLLGLMIGLVIMYWLGRRRRS